MTFEQILDAAVELLRRKQRITGAALKRQFDLDDQALADLKQELILGQRVAREEDGTVLVWQGPGAAAVPAPGALPAEAPRAEAERRQITIMFCDLADSTALSNSLDVEELRVVLRTFQAAAGLVIERQGGFVNSYMGDGILTLFGYPQAHEDDAKRAVRAGLELVAAVAALQPLPGGVRLRLRVGIATGTVVVGEVIGAGASREESVVGSTPNLAARLQSLALPGEVIVAASTHKLLGSRFRCIDLGRQALKGFDEPIPVWRVQGERAVEAMGQGLDGALPLPPMVDREIEFPALLDSWRSACAGEARVVTLRGEAGLGKSRLCEAVREAAAEQSPALLRFYCSSQFQNTALYPVIRQIEHAAGWSEDDTPKTRLDKLVTLMSVGLPAEDVTAAVPYMAALLSLPTGGRYPAIADSPDRQRELTLRALQAQITGLARVHPVLILFEDLHWADPSTLSLIHQLALNIGAARVMLLATSRPEFEPPWHEQPNALTLELSLLKRHHRSCIVEHHAGGKALPPEILEHILQKSDGIPLYVEELTKAMMESGLLREESDHFVQTGSMRSMTIPSTLHDSLLARLDRLSVVKEVAQAGAVIGRDFDYQTLAALLTLAPAELNASLARLTEAGLLHSRGLPPDVVYTFKHALIQDAAYATMLRPRRQGLHARIAQILEADPEATLRGPELLAHHLIEADQIDRAVPYLLAAGLQASASAAHTEACKHFNEGLRLTAGLSDIGVRHRLELKLRVHLGMSLAATRGFAAPEVEACNQSARALCSQVGDTDEFFWVLRALSVTYLVRADMTAACELADQCARIAGEAQRDEFHVEAQVMSGYAYGFAGQFDPACAAFERARQIYRDTAASRYAYPTPQDPLVAGLAFFGGLAILRGDYIAGRAHCDAAISHAESLNRPFGICVAYTYAAFAENLARNPLRAAEYAGKVIELAQRHGFADWLGSSAMQLGVAKAGLGDAGQAQEAIALISSTLPAWHAAGAEVCSGFFLAGLADAHRTTGQLDDALLAVNRAIAHAASHGERWYDAALHDQRASLLAQQANSAAAGEPDWRRAIDIARQQGAHTLELRAAMNLARALAPGGELRLASQPLQDALQQCPLAHGSPDHREASALLAELMA